MIGLFLIKVLLEKNNSLKKNFIARTNLFGNFAKSLRPVILKSTESSHGLVNFQKQSPGENVFFSNFKKSFGKNLWRSLFLKKCSPQVLSCKFCWIFKNIFFCRTPWWQLLNSHTHIFFIRNSSHHFYKIFLAKTLFQNTFLQQKFSLKAFHFTKKKVWGRLFSGNFLTCFIKAVFSNDLNAFVCFLSLD